MRGTSFLLVIVFLSGIFPILVLDAKIQRISDTTNIKLVQIQSIKNTQADIIRTFSEMAHECKKSKSKEICALYLAKWTDYWKSKGFKVISGELNRYNVVIQSNPVLFPDGMLAPSTNITNFGIVVNSKKVQVVIRGGNWTSWD